MDQQLQVFIKVAERKNFSRAAEDLWMTQPAVSQYIRSFEEEIGAKLLERTNKYVQLTKAGEIVYRHAKKITGLHTKMQTLVDDLMNHASGPLTIGASFTFGEYVLPQIIAKMKVNYPEIHPTISIGNTKEIVSDMIHHQVDIGIIEGHFANEFKLHVEDFAEDQMIIVAAPDHPFARKDQFKQMFELMQEKWVLREIGSGTREAADTVFENEEISPENIINFGSTQAIKEAVGAGLGISLLSRWAVQRELYNRDLVTIPVAELPFIRKFSVVTDSPYQTKAQQVFIELLHRSKEITELNF